MKQMTFSFYKSPTYVLNLVVHTEKPPGDEEWDAYITAIKSYERELPRVRTMVITEGGGPNSAQRRTLNDFLRGRTTLVVLVSSSPIARGITTALSWFNPKVRSFAPDTIDAAFEYLGVAEQDKLPIWTQIRKLRAELGYNDPRSFARSG